MRYFTQLMVERRRESILRLNREIEQIKTQIKTLTPRQWHKKRLLKEEVNLRRSWIHYCYIEIERASQ